MDFLFVLAHIWSACSIQAIRPCSCLRSLVCSSLRNFRLRRSSLEWKSNITLDKGQKLIVCAKKSTLKANTLYLESQPPDTPKNRDTIKPGILPDGDRKRREPRRQDPSVLSSGEYLSL